MLFFKRGAMEQPSPFKSLIMTYALKNNDGTYQLFLHFHGNTWFSQRYTGSLQNHSPYRSHYVYRKSLKKPPENIFAKNIFGWDIFWGLIRGRGNV